MRARFLRPEFWQDERMAELPDSVRLFYIGLWMLADDAGWLEWRPAPIGANLYPYRAPTTRLRQVKQWATQLEKDGRLVLHPCGCAVIPTLEKHQPKGGNPTFRYRDRHAIHVSTDLSAPSTYSSVPSADSPKSTYSYIPVSPEYDPCRGRGRGRGKGSTGGNPEVEGRDQRNGSGVRPVHPVDQ